MSINLRTGTLTAAVLCLQLSAPLGAQGNKTLLVEGLQLPFKLVLTPGGNLLVSEAGGPPNTGRISIVNRGGSRFSLLEGLPSGPAYPELTPIGPTGMVLRDRTLYAAIAEGDAIRGGPTQGSIVLNPAGVSSPLFSSVMTFRFDDDPDHIASPFVMTAQHQSSLADGHSVTIENAQGRKVQIHVLAKFQSMNFDPQTVYRHSDPFGLAMGPGRGSPLYLVDAGRNTVVQIDTLSGRWHVLTRFAPLRNPTSVGPPMIDYVPSAAMVHGS